MSRNKWTGKHMTPTLREFRKRKRLEMQSLKAAAWTFFTGIGYCPAEISLAFAKVRHAIEELEETAKPWYRKA